MSTLKVLPLSLVLIAALLMRAEAASNEGKVLKVTGLSVCPFFCGVDQNGVAKGVDMDVLRIVAEKLKYSIEFEASRGFSTVLNGSAIGPVAQVSNGSVQVAIGHVPILYVFNDSVDSSSPLYEARSHNDSSCLDDKKDMALQQCQNWDYRSSSSKLIFICFWLTFSTLIWSGYKSLLQASLISVDFEEPIETASDVLATNAPFYFVEKRALNHLMRTSSKRVYREIMARAEKEKNHLKPSPTEGYNSRENIGILERRKAVTVIMDTTFPFVAEAARASLGYNPFRIGSEPLYVSYAAFALPKNSLLSSKFEQVMPFAIAGGLVDKAFANNMPIFHKTDAKIDEGNDVPLEMDHFVVGLGFLALGLVLASILFALEIKSYSEKIEKQRQTERLFLKTTRKEGK